MVQKKHEKMISNKLPINAKLFLFGFNPEDDNYNKNEQAIMIVFKEKKQLHSINSTTLIVFVRGTCRVRQTAGFTLVC